MTNRVITIGREFGSGGREVGIKLSEKLGIPFYDKEIISLAARAGGLDEKFIESNEEKAPGLSTTGFGRMSFASFAYQPSLSDTVFMSQSEAIKSIAAKGPCVIVGRCADYVLRKRDTLDVFISASMPYKVARKRPMAPEKKDLSDADFEKYIADIDKKRKKYYEHYTGRDWGQISTYDLCIHTDLVGVDGAVETILTYLNNIK